MALRYGDPIILSASQGFVQSESDLSVDRHVHMVPWRSGRWYDSRYTLGGPTIDQALIANTIYTGGVIDVPEPTEIDAVGFNVAVAGAAATFARVMLHVAGGPPGAAGALLLDAGTVLVDATGARIIPVSFTLPAGLVVPSIVSNGTPSVTMAYGQRNLYGGTNPGETYVGGTLGFYRIQANTNAPNPWGVPDGPFIWSAAIGVRVA